MDPHPHPLTRPTISDHLRARQRERIRDRLWPLVPLLIGAAVAVAAMLGAAVLRGTSMLDSPGARRAPGLFHRAKSHE
jgi:hypothetical protein